MTGIGVDTPPASAGAWKCLPTPDEVVRGLGGGRLTPAGEAELKGVLTELERARRDAPVFAYAPYESRLRPGRYPQREFHLSSAKIRVLLGGNRSGKSEAGIVEDVLTALGRHPAQRYPVPNHGWIVSLDFPTSRDVAEEKVRKLLPASMIARWDEHDRVIQLRNGSTIGFRSCDQDTQKFGGAARHWIHFDEEPPGSRGYRIYQECLMRLMDYGGGMWFTMTPVEGVSWTYDEFYEPWRSGRLAKEIEVFSIETGENPHIGASEIDLIRRLCPDEQTLAMRLKGQYVQFSGLVYREFGPHNIVPAHPIPEDWRRFRGLDVGINDPTACVFLAVGPQDRMVVYDEYYETDKTVRENAEAIRAVTGGARIEWTCIDPATEARDMTTGKSIRDEFRQHGIHTRALRTDKPSGINTIKQMLKSDPLTGRPQLTVFDTCHNLIREFGRYRYRDYKAKEDKNRGARVQDYLDHALDALRYLVMSRPRYEIDDATGPQPQPWY